MSGIATSIKKKFKKNPLLTTVVAAAAIWFTAGTAAAYFAPGSAGIGSAMATSGANMWSGVSAAFGGEAAAGGATTIAPSGAQVGSIVGGEAVAGVPMAATEGLGAAATVSPAAEAAAYEASIGSLPAGANASSIVSGGSVTGVPMSATEGVGALSGEVAGAAQSAGVTAAEESAMYQASINGAMPEVAGGNGIVGNAMAWMGDNPIPAMILGQAGVGAYSGYLDDKADKRADEQRKERGLGGYDWNGKYAGQRYQNDPSTQMANSQGGGIVNSQQNNIQAARVDPASTEQNPLALPEMASVQRRPVNRADLPALNKQGLIANT